MFNCKKDNCNGNLIEDGNDTRQEWRRIYYHCQDCETCYERLTTYKTQSHLVQNDTLYMIDERGNSIEVE